MSNLPSPAFGGITANVVPDGATTAIALSHISSQQGVLLDAFRLATDVDDTNSLTRAVTAGVTILLGPKTYIVNNWVQPAASAVVMIGVPDVSTIQRSSVSGSTFMNFTAAKLRLYGIIFDMNKAAVADTQWGVWIATGSGQVADSVIDRCVFKNNSGSLGGVLAYLGTGPILTNRHAVYASEFTGATWSAIYIGSSSNITITDDCWIHDNAATAINVLSLGTVSTTNYSAFVTVSQCRIERNAGGGIGFGGHAPPYDPTTGIQAKNCYSINNVFVDNGATAIAPMGDNIDIIGGSISNPSGGSMFCAINGYGRQIRVRDVDVDLSLVGSVGDAAIDLGGCVNPEIKGCTVISPRCLINIGACQNAIVEDNKLVLLAGALGIGVNAMESDGAGAVMPYVGYGLRIKSNVFVFTETATPTATAIQLMDAASNIVIADNDFDVIPGGSTSIAYRTIVSQGASFVAFGNRLMGGQVDYTDANASGVLVIYDAYDDVRGLGSTQAIGQIQTYNYNLYFGRPTSIQVLTPGTGYNKATTTVTLSPAGCGVATPFFNADGSVAFVRVNPIAYGGTVTATITDSSGAGSGCTLAVTIGSPLPKNKKITYVAYVAINFNFVGGPTQICTPGNTTYALRARQAIYLQEQDGEWSMQ